MECNFECCYMSVGGTYCFHNDSNIIDDLGNNECNDCDMNLSCNYCSWNLSEEKKFCVDCTGTNI